MARESKSFSQDLISNVAYFKKFSFLKKERKAQLQVGKTI